MLHWILPFSLLVDMSCQIVWAEPSALAPSGNVLPFGFFFLNKNGPDVMLCVTCGGDFQLVSKGEGTGLGLIPNELSPPSYPAHSSLLSLIEFVSLLVDCLGVLSAVQR